MNQYPFHLLSIRRKREKFYLVVNTIPIGYVDENTLKGFRIFLEKHFKPEDLNFFEVHFPRLEQDDETHDVSRAIGIEVEAEREACAHVIDMGVEVATNMGEFTDANFLRGFAKMIRERSKATGLESTEIYKALAEASSNGERRGQAWGLWQAFEYSAQIAEQEHYGELGAEIAAEIRKDGAAHDSNEWARVVLRAEIKGQTRGAEIERERLAQLIEAHPLNMLNLMSLEARSLFGVKDEIRRILAEAIRGPGPGGYPFTDREIAAHILRSIGDELWGIGRRNEDKTPGEGLALSLKTIAADMRQKAKTLKEGGQNEESNQS